jgi:prepilin-type N-terminal cleavage/methylation domain-containing protein
MPPTPFSKSRIARTERGFSLLETILALVLLGIALTSMVRLLADSVGVMERGRRAGQALVIASAVADGLQAAPADQVRPGGAMALGRIEADRLVASWRVSPMAGHDRLLVLDVEVARSGGRPGSPVLARVRALRPSW